MYDAVFAPKSGGLRLYDLLVQFQQGDKNSFESIIKRFNWMLSKASYNSNIGGLDDDLRSEIYLALFLKLQQFKIPDNNSFNSMQAVREDDLLALQSAPV
jgi:hypothetical protein